eukprot:scaffold259694_cov30-Tisochrysis_lutea.AAC.2
MRFSIGAEVVFVKYFRLERYAFRSRQRQSLSSSRSTRAPAYTVRYILSRCHARTRRHTSMIATSKSPNMAAATPPATWGPTVLYTVVNTARANDLSAPASAVPLTDGEDGRCDGMPCRVWELLPAIGRGGWGGADLCNSGATCEDSSDSGGGE